MCNDKKKDSYPCSKDLANHVCVGEAKEDVGFSPTFAKLSVFYVPVMV